MATLRVATAFAAADERDALAELWVGMYDLTEELVVGAAADDSPLASLEEQERVQINVRRVSLPWLGTHVLYVEEFPYDEPFESRRRVLLDIGTPDATGALRVRQFTRKTGARTGGITPDDVETDPGCDLLLKREGSQFRGGTQARTCLEREAREPRWLDYRVVIADGVFWYRKRTLSLAHDDLLEEIAGFPHVDPGEARLFSCGITWSAPRGKGPAERRALDSVDLHDRGGRARFRTPDGRELSLELHGRDWPLASGRESLVLILRGGAASSDSIASSWTSLDAARVGIDIGWLAIDCAPVVSDSGEQDS